MKMKIICTSILLWAWAPITYSQELAPGACHPVPGGQSCVDATPCKPMTDGQTVCLSGVPQLPGALQVPQKCWQYSYEYACDTPKMANSCKPYEDNPACAVVSSTCTDTRNETGTCTSWNYTYQCETKPAVTSPQLVCSSGLFDTSTLVTPNNPNNTFITAAIAMEIARQTQIYGQGKDMTVFGGVVESCTKGYFGIRNCCGSMPGAQNNRSFLTTLAGSAAYSGLKYVGQNAVDYASPYVFDAMYSSGMFTDGLMTSIASAGNVLVNEADSLVATNFAANGVSLGAYGFTYGTGVFEAGSALPGTMDLSSTFGMGAGEGFITFNPYVFAAMLVIQYLQTLAQCSEDEMMFQMHKGANLVVYNEEKCTSSVLGKCVETTQTYCAFNSVLAKIINIQGKKQLGLNTADCLGLTVEQVSKLDFTKIDFSEFTGAIIEEAQKNLPKDIKSNYTPVIKNTSKGTSQNTTNGSAYPPKP